MVNSVGVLQKLYASEVIVSIESDWDKGFTVGIGNQRKGFDTTEHFDTDKLHLAAERLDQKARQLQPRSVKGD
jgi:hypothetical protein